MARAASGAGLYSSVMPASLTITLNQLALALLGAGACIYYCRSQGGYWKACALVCGQRIERDHPSPYAALAATAAVLYEYEAQQHSLDAYDQPAARAAYRAAWDASEGQPVAARFAAAQAAARAAITLPPHSLKACPECDAEASNNPDNQVPNDLREYDSSGPYEDEAGRLYRQEQRIAYEQYHPHH